MLMSSVFSSVLMHKSLIIIDCRTAHSECLAGSFRLHMLFPSRANEDYVFLAGFWRRAKAKVSPGVISAIVSVRTKAWELISRRVYELSPLEGAAYGTITSSHQRRTTWPSLLPPASVFRLYLRRVEACLDGQTNGQTKRPLRANRQGLPPSVTPPTHLSIPRVHEPENVLLA